MTTTFNPSEFEDELATAVDNKSVGTKLLFENERVRVWELELVVGQRAPFHCHSIDYFWVAADPGPVVQRTSDGILSEVCHEKGQVKFFTFRDGDTLVHDLENIGSETVRYVTVEMLDGDNTMSSEHSHTHA
ncbi:MAG: hypothetical protein JWR90_3500 [Marmoricola sp.]|jgi:hypothetical protein|nr:hypothetical protein [Marmoricola sp.]